jgi:predicted Fe-Mo cluster-binding NifX family protein
MKLCIPVKENNGMKSHVYSHFGSASAYLIYDTDTDTHEIIENNNQHHAHGACMPMESINGKGVNAVLVGGIGARALERFNNENISVYQAVDSTAGENVEMFKTSHLREFTSDDACAHHRQHNHGGMKRREW